MNIHNYGYEHYIHNLEIVRKVLRKFGYNDQLIRATFKFIKMIIIFCFITMSPPPT